MSLNEEEKNEIEVITGDDSDLEISNVYDHLNINRVREDPDEKEIVIPEVKKDKEEKNE